MAECLLAANASRTKQNWKRKPMSRICSGIVTYNPDVSRLKSNISAIAPQVEEVIIFDNGSNNLDDVLSFASSNISIIPSEENKGMAVALNALANEAIKRNYDEILLLDQDSVSTESMVKELSALSAPDVGIVCPCKTDRNSMGEEDTYKEEAEALHTITSGSLVNLSIFEEVGGYDERLFVDWVDLDYCHNLRLHGYRILRASEAVLIHELGHKEYVMSIPRKNPNGKWGLRKYYRSGHSLFRQEDKVRSQTIVLAKYKGTPVYKEALIPVLSSNIFDLILEKHKWALLKAKTRGHKRGKAAFR